MKPWSKNVSQWLWKTIRRNMENTSKSIAVHKHYRTIKNTTQKQQSQASFYQSFFYDINALWDIVERKEACNYGKERVWISWEISTFSTFGKLRISRILNQGFEKSDFFVKTSATTPRFSIEAFLEKINPGEIWNLRLNLEMNNHSIWIFGVSRFRFTDQTEHFSLNFLLPV